MTSVPPRRGLALAAAALLVPVWLTACSSPSASVPTSPNPVTGSAATDSSATPATPTSPAESSAASTAGTTTGTAAASASPSDSVPTYTITVTGKKVSPAPATVQITANTKVRLVVTSDVANELHLHGVDVEKPLPAGTATTVEVSYPTPGTYEVETHEPSLLLLRFQVS